MKSIFKYQLKTTDLQEIEMPELAEVLCVQVQNGIPCIWAKVETENALKKRAFFVVGTGNPLPDNPSNYIGTYQLYDGGLVFHLFELN